MILHRAPVRASRLAAAAAALAAFLAPAALGAQPTALSPAAVQPTPAPPSGTPPTLESGWPLAATQRPLTLARGLCQVALVGEANLTKRESLHPVSLAPDAACGVSDRLTVGLVTSARSLSRVDSGDGLCLGGTEGDPVHDCQRPVDNAAVDGLYLLRGGDLAVAARARLVFASFGPVKPSVRLGALVRLRRGRAALVLDPAVGIGLGNRDRGNRDTVALPVVGQLQLGPRVLVELETGVRGELAVFGDAYQVPVGAALQVSPSAAWDVGLELGWPELLGPRNTFKERHLSLWLSWRPGRRLW